jgi:hypothetical protein
MALFVVLTRQSLNDPGSCIRLRFESVMTEMFAVGVMLVVVIDFKRSASRDDLSRP